MLYLSIFDAKENVTVNEINREREEWYQRGCNKTLIKMCKRINRYEVAGKSPQRIVFVIETDDARALNILPRHFGNMWTCATYPALERDIIDTMNEDKTIVCG